MMDRLFGWFGWYVVKWIFGGILLYFILLQIFNLETIPDYDKKVVQDIKTVSLKVKDFTVLLVKSLSVRR